MNFCVGVVIITDELFDVDGVNIDTDFILLKFNTLLLIDVAVDCRLVDCDGFTSKVHCLLVSTNVTALTVGV